MIARALLACALWAAVGSAGAQASASRVEQESRPAPEPIRRDALKIQIPPSPGAVPAGAEQASFVLGAVQLVGNRALHANALESIWAGRLGKTVTLAEAYGFAAAITTRYRAAGYLLSQALLPAQDIRTDGTAVLRIEILEGYVEQVAVRGVESTRLVALMEAVTRERPLSLATLERSLLIVNELPGLSAQANLRAGSAPASSVLELLAVHDPAAFSVLVHNRGNPAQGEVRYEVAGERRGLLGDFDRHALRWVSSGDKRLQLLAYTGEAPVGGDGLKTLWSASSSTSQPRAALANVDTESRSYTLGTSYPMLRSRRANAGLRAAWQASDNESGEGLLARDRLRVVRVGLTADLADAVGITLVDTEFSKGLKSMGASKPDDPLLNGARPDFSKFTAYLARLQNLGGPFSLLLAVTASQSGDRLPTSEQLGLGGEQFLRGFDPSEVIGEKGYAAKLELRLGAEWAGVSSTWYVFGDTGKVTRAQVNAPGVETALSSYGAGVRLTGPRGLKGHLEVAQPMKKDVTSQGNRDARVFAALGIDF